MLEMISSPDFSGEPHLMAQYMSNIARAGVIVNSAFPNLESGGDVPMVRPPSALSGMRVPTTFSGSSSVLSEDSFEHQNTVQKPPPHKLDPAGHMSVHKDPDWEASRSRPHSRPLFKEEDILREELNDPLLRKLEQLKEIQQQKQEQLKQQQMEQLQKLMEEQKMLLNLVSRQPAYSEHEQQNLISGHVGSSMSKKQLSRLMSPVSGNIPRVSPYMKREMLAKNRSPSRPTSVSVRELSPEKSKTLEELLNEEDTEGHSGDECGTEDSSHGEVYTVMREPLIKNNADDRPIDSGIKERKKSFEELLEEQIRIEEQRLKQMNLQQVIEQQSKSKPAAKRPFLRRGQGLARFKNTPNKQSKPQESKAISQNVSEVTAPQLVEKIHVQRKIAPLSKDLASERGLGVTKITAVPAGEKNETTHKKAVLKNHKMKHSASLVAGHGHPEDKTTISGRHSVPLERKAMLELDKDNVDSTKSTDISNKVHDGDKKGAEFSFEVSFQKRAVTWEKEKQNEHYELDEFLLLEQAAEDLSFSSNSSFVQKLLDHNFHTDNRRLSSTPVKLAENRQEKEGNAAKNKSGVKFYEKMEGQGSMSKNSLNIVQTGKTTSELLRTSEEAKKSPICDLVSSEGDYASSGEEHNNSISSENEDVDSDGSVRDHGPNTEELKGSAKKLNDSKKRDFDLDLSDGEDNENKEKTLLAENSKASLIDHNSSSSSDSSQVVFDDERTWDDLGNVQSLKGVYESTFATKTFIPSEYTSTSPTDALDKAVTRKVASKKGDQLKATNTSTPSTPPASELMMKLFPALKPKAKPETLSVTKPVSSQDGPGDAIRSQLLKEKLVELETEIERFKVENASLARLREDKEKTLEALRKEVADFEQQKAKELARIEEYKKEEMKKLQKERKVFEKYASAARAIPDKKEREEIQTLKQQIKDLQEELKKKETKWSTTHIRLRNQIETLLKENGELREEIKFMEKVRLETWKKAEVVDTKKKISEAPISQLKRSESVSPMHMLKQRRTSAPESERSSRSVRSNSPIKGLSVRSFRQTSLSDSSNSETSKIKAAEPVTSTTPQITDKVLPTEPKNDSSLVKDYDDVQGEITYPDGKVERILRNGCHLIVFPNGTRKEVSPDGRSTTVTFFNGDVKQVMADQRVIYYYADAQTTHTTYPDGLEILQFSNGQIEKHFPDGKKEITFPDQTIKNLYHDGREESIFPDGTIITTHLDGTKVIEFDNGQRELHTVQFKRREYPDGTVKTVYTNGQQETKYASGRVRVKDKDGNIIMDTKL